MRTSEQRFLVVNVDVIMMSDIITIITIIAIIVIVDTIALEKTS